MILGTTTLSKMVSSGSIVTMCVTLFIALFLPPIILVIYSMRNKNEGVGKAWLLGAAGFFVTQVLARMPILTKLSLMDGFLSFVEKNYLLYAILLAVTAALFEVVGRYLVAKILSEKLTFTKGVAAGLGHGGIEAMVLIGMSYISNLIYVAMINTGMFEMILAQAEATSGENFTALLTLAETIVNTPAYMYLLAGYERILTMICHTAMTLFVFYFMWKKQTLKGIGICVLFHTLLDGIVGIVSGLATPYLGSVISQNVSYVIIYIYLTVMAVVSVVIIRKIKAAWE